MIANGIEARVVRDTVTENGAPVEITDDWYAQDKAGYVWYQQRLVGVGGNKGGRFVGHRGGVNLFLGGPGIFMGACWLVGRRSVWSPAES
jgi:hypothetical protein